MCLWFWIASFSFTLVLSLIALCLLIDYLMLLLTYQSICLALVILLKGIHKVTHQKLYSVVQLQYMYLNYWYKRLPQCSVRIWVLIFTDCFLKLLYYSLPPSPSQPPAVTETNITMSFVFAASVHEGSLFVPQQASTPMKKKAKKSSHCKYLFTAHQWKLT